MSTSAATLPIIPELRNQIMRLFAGLSGWACLRHCDGDPQIEDVKETWYEWSRQISSLLADAFLYAERGYNVYIRQCLFGRRKASYDTGLSSPWIWARPDLIPARCASVSAQLTMR